jgi:hypothetical protein
MSSACCKGFCWLLEHSYKVIFRKSPFPIQPKYIACLGFLYLLLACRTSCGQVLSWYSRCISIWWSKKTISHLQKQTSTPISFRESSFSICSWQLICREHSNFLLAMIGALTMVDHVARTMIGPCTNLGQSQLGPWLVHALTMVNRVSRTMIGPCTNHGWSQLAYLCHAR